MKPMFLFANGRVSALERDFLPTRMWQMLISSRDVEEAGRLLADTWFGRFLSAGDFDSCFELAMQATEQELSELSEDPALVRGLLHRRDVRNARYVWKAHFTGEPVPSAVERQGLIPVDALRKAAEGDEEALELLPVLFREALASLAGMENPSARDLDNAMDRLAAAVELEELPSMGQGFGRFLHARIDILNFMTAGRSRISGMDRSRIEDLMLDGGSRSPAEIAQAAVSGTLHQLIADTTELETLGAVLREALVEKSFLEYSREAERILITMLDTGAFAVFGPSPLAAFVIKKELEISHLRILLAAKAAGMDRARLLKRLPRG